VCTTQWTSVIEINALATHRPCYAHVHTDRIWSRARDMFLLPQCDNEEWKGLNGASNCYVLFRERCEEYHRSDYYRE
jgi:hypothetical protein